MQRNPIFRNEFKTRWSFSPIKRFSILGQKKGLWFLVSAHVAADPRVEFINLYIYLFIYLFILWKIAGSIGILPCCVLSDFFTIIYISLSMFLLYEASVSRSLK